MSKRCMGCMELFGDEFKICPHCGYIEGTLAEEAIHMEPGTLLYDRYIIGKVLGFGGFGVTYIGWDGKLEQKVAIKEYLPSEFSTRMPGQSTVTVFNGDKSEQFRDGLNKFVEEAKRLAKFQNEPGIVKVFDSFTENETAYIVMEFLDGETLTEYLKREHTIPEEDAVNMLMPVMNSLQVVHQEGILHRDIAPDNIFLTKTGEVKLIDFGASRYATTSHSRSLTVIIKPGYSPEEQYRSRGDQGPYTDIYALAATMYKMITGKTPPDAMERRAKIENQRRDILELPHRINKTISVNRENALLNAMNVRIEDRTANVSDFINELNANPPVKRRYGKIKKIDIYSWPLWLKIAVPSALAILLVFGTLLFTGVLFPSLFTDEIVVPEGMVVVPDVEEMDKDEALKILEENNLTPSPEGNITSDYIEAGKIVLQTPVGGSYLEEYGTVLLTISSGNGVIAPINGTATVPYVVWDTQEDAIAKLKEAGLAEPTIKKQSDENVEGGKVISQSIESGTKVDEGTKITIIVSTGPPPFDMPNVVGNTEKSATQTLKGKGLVVSIEYTRDNSIENGKVVSQEPNAGTSLIKGSSVTIYVSKDTALVYTDWITSLPDGIDSSNYAIDTRIEYRYKTREIKQSFSRTMSGWNLIDSTITGWSSWSSWQKSEPIESNSREVESKQVEATYKYLYQYDIYVHSTVNTNTGVETVKLYPYKPSGSYAHYTTPWIDRLPAVWDSQYGCNKYGPYGTYEKFDYWYNEKSKTVVEQEAHTEYRYRDAIHTYTFEKWGDWSSWSTQIKTINSNTKVETRTVYRYAKK